VEQTIAGGEVQMTVKRKQWLDEKRAQAVERYDRIFSEDYDEKWGEISPSHKKYVEEILGRLSPGDSILDAACGTGKYWPFLGDYRVTGIDQSGQMLAKLKRKYPEATTHVQSLQELELDNTFSGILCIDAMENIPPEDWGIVIANFSQHLEPAGFLYITVEQTTEEQIRKAHISAKKWGLPVLPGEVALEVYHFYPLPQNVKKWLTDEGFAIIRDDHGDGYWHLLCQKKI
jgi:ubiquinone/menaquinone biosynthesis C-methylase UbiE